MTEWAVKMYGIGIGLNGFYGDDVIGASCLVFTLMSNDNDY